MIANVNIVGTCALCGGYVTMPGMWSGTRPPPASCVDCHALADPDAWPVIQMRKPGPLKIIWPGEAIKEAE